MKHYNARPSTVPNIGEDILGAHRHKHDTYETPEELSAKAFKKASDKRLKVLKLEYAEKLKSAIAESTEAARACLMEYEMKRACLSHERLESFNGTAQELRDLVLSQTDATREELRKVFNRLVRNQKKIRYERPIKLHQYFESKSKEKFTEINGREVTWKTESTSFDSSFLESKVRAVQFGNSLPENERIYCSEKLIESIKILERYFSIDWKSLGFAFGARGIAGSIAHYQDSKKVLQFNRGWDGAFIHELGHAIDYALGLPSNDISFSIRSKYRQKLSDNNIGSKIHYYMKNKEIFARLFEAYVRASIPEVTTFMLFNETCATIPDLDEEAIEFMGRALRSIMKEEQTS